MGMLAPVIAYLGMDITGFKAGAAESKTIMRGLQGEGGTGGLSKSFKMLGAVAAGGAIALGVASVHMAADFQTNMTKLVTSAGETKANLGMVSDGVLKLAVDTGTSTNQLSAGLYMIESAGYHGAAGLNVLKASAQGARAEGADLNEVANAVTSALNAYHLPASQAVAVTDQLVATVSSGKMRMQDLASSISNVLPVAAAAHISLAQVGGAIATMTAQGMSADQASQDLAFSIRALQSPSVTAQQAMAAVGLSSTDLAQNLGSRGLTGTMQMVSEAILQHMGPDGLVLLNSFNDSKQAAASLTAMLGKMPAGLRSVSQEFQQGGITASQYSKDIKKLPVDQQALGQNFESLVKRADGFQQSLKSGSGASVTFTSEMSKVMGGATGLNTALMLTGGNAKAFGTNVNTVADAAKTAGANVNGWGEIQHTFNFKLSQLKETAATTGIKIGTVLIPAIETAVGFFARHQNAALALAGVIGGVLLAAMLNFAVATVSATAATAKLLATTIAENVADWAETAAITAMVVAENIASAATAVLDAVMDANPIMLIVLAVIALGAALYEAYQHIGWFRRIVQDAFHAIGAVASWLWNHAIKPVWGAFMAETRFLASVVMDVWQDAIEPALKGIGVAALWLWHDAIEPVFQGIAAVVSWAWSNVIQPVGQFMIALLRFEIATALWLIEHIFEAVWKATAAVVQWAWSNVIKPAWDGIVIGTKALGAVALWLWQNAFKPAIDGIVIAALWLWHNVFEPAWRGIGAAVQWAWNNVIQPAWSGIKTGLDGIQTAALWLWHQVFEPAWHGIGVAVSDAWNNVIKPIFDTIKQYINDIVSGFNKVTSFGKGILHAGTGLLNKASSLLGFADGGWVPGAVGQAQLAVVHGGEYVLSHDMITGSARIDPEAVAATAGSLAGNNGGGYGTTPAGGGSSGGITIIVQGSILSDRDLADTLMRVMPLEGHRNGVTWPTFST